MAKKSTKIERENRMLNLLFKIQTASIIPGTAMQEMFEEVMKTKSKTSYHYFRSTLVSNGIIVKDTIDKKVVFEYKGIAVPNIQMAKKIVDSMATMASCSNEKHKEVKEKLQTKENVTSTNRTFKEVTSEEPIPDVITLQYVVNAVRELKRRYQKDNTAKIEITIKVHQDIFI